MTDQDYLETACNAFAVGLRPFPKDWVKLPGADRQGLCRQLHAEILASTQPADVAFRKQNRRLFPPPPITPPAEIEQAEQNPLANPVRHLVYHVGPFAGNGVWRWNVEQILRRITLFNGKRAVAIITGAGMDSPDEVKRAFRGEVESFAMFPNDPDLREVVSRPWLFDQIATTGQNEITFTGHAKGVTKPDHVNVRRWTELMYETCLDYMPLVEALLRAYPLAGSFRRHGQFFQNSASEWHYSGTFYWLRNNRAFAHPNWRVVDRSWWGTESWPGLHFPSKEAGVIFYDNEANLYEDDSMQKVELAYADWKKANHAMQSM